jgi:hypothetical protein
LLESGVLSNCRPHRPGIRTVEVPGTCQKIRRRFDAVAKVVGGLLDMEACRATRRGKYVTPGCDNLDVAQAVRDVRVKRNRAEPSHSDESEKWQAGSAWQIGAGRRNSAGAKSTASTPLQRRPRSFVTVAREVGNSSSPVPWTAKLRKRRQTTDGSEQALIPTWYRKAPCRNHAGRRNQAPPGVGSTPVRSDPLFLTAPHLRIQRVQAANVEMGREEQELEYNSQIKSPAAR